MSIAEKIKAARNRAGMSQQELADAIHVSRSAVAKWEADKGLPDIENLKAIARVFGMTLDELAMESEQAHCTLQEAMLSQDPEEAVRARWPEAVRIDWLLLRHDFGKAGRILNALSFGWFGLTWLRAWGSIPPAHPERLGAFLGRITRNLALDRLRTEKRQCHIREELGECLTQGDPTAGLVERVVLTAALDRFLAGLTLKKRKLFLQRYWYFCTVEELARDFGMSESSVKMTLLRLRRELKKLLQQEGIEP